ncbi:hypothetical protein PI95_020970 [Hassallia byssoidea VB512170]|uniref:Uncharacterized protein n=1 Tax=Hassallia byssoidea VB512170 TaxID=1304833 RepID=A0A846HEC6_9CYAN|nr:hypothetical protein [Hassalia byssoidea]NEU74960.1 hypothetical protein [Hassalia byssoidea VB512170]
MASNSQASELLRKIEEQHKEDIETITQVLARITSRSPSEIKSQLGIMLERLVEPQQKRFLYETATPSQLKQAFRQWAESHEHNTPLLSDYAVSRESIYDDEV